MTIEILTELIQNKKPEKKWLYEIQHRMIYKITGVFMPECDIYHGNHMLASIHNNCLIIYAKYAYDGLTCFPDTKANLPAGLLHDFGYQTGFWSQEICDLMFYTVMKNRKAWGAKIAYAGVRAFGGNFYGKETGINIKYYNDQPTDTPR